MPDTVQVQSVASGVPLPLSTPVGPPIKVLLLLHDLSHTGAPKIAVDAFERMQKAGTVEVRSIAMQHGPLHSRAAALGTVYPFYFPSRAVVRTPRGAFGYARRRAAMRMWPTRLSQWQPDLIYANSVATLPLARDFALPKVPVLLHVHELELLLNHYDRVAPGLLQHWPTRYIAVSQPVQTALERDFNISSEKIALIHEFMDDAAVINLAKRVGGVTYPQDKGRFIVGGAGRIQWRKGGESWLRMAASLTQLLGPDRVRFVWVGGESDDAEREFRLMADKLGVGELLELIQMTPDPLPMYARFDVFAMTSWEDPCPLVVLENMALGKPVACFDGSGGAPEEVGDTGLVAPRFDPVVMAAQIADLAQNPTHLQAMGSAARERSMTHFTATRQVPQIAREIERLARPES